MSTSPMAARECWIYGECLKIRMMVPGAAAPGKQPGKQRHTRIVIKLCVTYFKINIVRLC